MSGCCFVADAESDGLAGWVRLLHKLDLTWTPRFIEERLQRAVETQDGKPTFFRVRLNPVSSFDTLWLLWSKVNRD